VVDSSPRKVRPTQNHAGEWERDKQLRSASQSTPPGINPRREEAIKDWRSIMEVPVERLPSKLVQIPKGIEEHHSIMLFILI
jgi:hypothetical protein